MDLPKITRRRQIGPLKTLTIAQISDYLPGVTYYTSPSTPGDQTGIYADMSTLQSYGMLGESTTLADGLKIFIDSQQ